MDKGRRLLFFVGELPQMSFFFFSIPPFFLKSCVCYVSAILFCMSKKEHVFDFTLKSSFILEIIIGIQMS